MSHELDSFLLLVCVLLKYWKTWVTPQYCNRPSGPLATNWGESCTRVYLLACIRVGSPCHMIGSRSLTLTTATEELSLARLQLQQKCSWYSGCTARFVLSFFAPFSFLVIYLFIFFKRFYTLTWKQCADLHPSNGGSGAEGSCDLRASRIRLSAWLERSLL